MNRNVIILLMGVAIFSGMASKACADPCDRDRALTCNDTVPGDGKVHDCLVGRMDRVAPACASALNRANQLANSVVEACRPEAQRWCAQYTGDGRSAVIDCLKSHKSQIGEKCKSAYRQFKAFGFDIRS